METKETIYVSYANQKGGCGKSTLTHIHAKALSIDNKKKVLVIECDKQGSLINQRINQLEKNPGFIFPYDLINCEVIEVGDRAKENFGLYDYIFIDIPGTLDINGIVGMLYNSDILIIPITSSNFDVDSSLSFMEMAIKVKEYKEKNNVPFDYYFVINKYDKQLRESKELIQIVEELNLPAFNVKIKDTVSYPRQQSDYNSPFKESTIKFNYSQFIEEFEQKNEEYLNKLLQLNN